MENVELCGFYRIFGLISRKLLVKFVVEDGMSKKKYITESREQTAALAAELAKNVEGGTVIAMRGDLGAGKTCFTSGFARGLGYKGDVNSPTFAIVNEYRGGRLDLIHFDMYRVSGWDDLYSTGYFEYLEENGVMIIEWSENIASALPENTVTVTVKTLGENSREITVEDCEK